MRKPTNAATPSAIVEVGADDYTTTLLEDLKDPVEAAAYLEAALQDADRQALLVAIRQMAASAKA
jgi:DNA-binding phage protein